SPPACGLLNRLPRATLLAPVQRSQKRGAQSPLADRLRTGCDFEEEDLLLDVRREEEQVHDLRDAGPAEAEGAGHVGVVAELAGVDAPLEGVREGELAGDAGGVASLAA